jgi:hypothetical protein
MKLFYRSSNFIFLATMSLVATSCANGAKPNYNAATNSAESVSPFVANGGTVTNGSFTCPLNPNVTPKNDTNFNGTDQFTVCVNPQVSGEIMINGETNSANQICVFPAVSTAAGVVANTSVQIQCPMLQSGGITLSYPNITYNAVYIVEAPYAAQMLYCLESGQNCPATYSYGEFQ